MPQRKPSARSRGADAGEMSHEKDEELATALRALGHPVRLNILRILAQRQSNQCCCNDVTDCLTLAQSTVSQHIKVLLDAGIVERQAFGTRNCYTVCASRLNSLKMAYDRYISSLNVSEDTPTDTTLSESV